MGVVPHQTSAQKEAAISGVGTCKLEVDELGLINLKPKTHDISMINPKEKVTREFCQPLLKSGQQSVDLKCESFGQVYL